LGWERALASRGDLWDGSLRQGGTQQRLPQERRNCEQAAGAGSLRACYAPGVAIREFSRGLSSFGSQLTVDTVQGGEFPVFRKIYIRA
jgi:hypothetical protein